MAALRNSLALLFMADTSKLSSWMSPIASCSSFAANEKMVATFNGLSLFFCNSRKHS